MFKIKRRSFLKQATVAGTSLFMLSGVSLLFNLEGPLEHQLAMAVQKNDCREVIRICNTGVSVNCEIPRVFLYSESELSEMSEFEHAIYKDGKTSLLTVAAKFNSLNVMIWLLDSGADPDGTENEFHPPLMLANSKEAVQILVSRGADVNAVEVGELMSCLFVHLKNKEIFYLLIESGADLERKNCSGNTVLGLAISWGSDLKDINYLLERGANTSNTGSFGKSAMQDIEGRILNLSNCRPEDLQKELFEIEQLKIMISKFKKIS